MNHIEDNKLIGGFMGWKLCKRIPKIYPDQTWLAFINEQTNEGFHTRVCVTPAPKYKTKEETKKYTDDFYGNYLKYPTDWNLLMPVVEKIEKEIKLGHKEELIEGTGKFENVTNSFWFNISYNQCVVNREALPQVYGTEEDFLNLYNCKNESKIEAVYRACVEFIKWYNQQSN